MTDKEAFAINIGGDPNNKKMLKTLEDVLKVSQDLVKMQKKINKNAAFESKQKKENIANLGKFKGVMESFSSVADKGLHNVGNLFSHIGDKAGSAFKSVMTGSATASQAIGSLAAALGPVALAAVAIGVGAFFMKKAWDVNMGGMQTKTSKFFAMVHKDWAMFNASLNKSMSDSYVFTGIINQVVVQVTLLYNVLKFIGKTLKLLWDISAIGVFISVIDKLAKKFGWVKDSADYFKQVIDLLNKFGDGFGVFDKAHAFRDKQIDGFIDKTGDYAKTSSSSATDSRIFNLYTQEGAKEHPSLINFLSSAFSGGN